jgi:exodeoxyribonuclease VII large subunit
LRALEATGRRLALAMRRRLSDQRHALSVREQRLARVHPGVVLRQHAQRLDELEGRLRRAGHARLERATHRFAAVHALLRRASPVLRVAALNLRLDAARRGLAHCIRGHLVEQRRRFELAARALDAVSPLATLERGYAIVADAGGKVVQDSTVLRPGDRITARLARGSVTAEVLAVEPGPPSSTEAPDR